MTCVDCIDIQCYFDSSNSCEIRNLIVEQANIKVTKVKNYNIETEAELRNKTLISETKIFCGDSKGTNDINYLPIGLIEQFDDEKSGPKISKYVVEGCADLRSLLGNEFNDGATLKDLSIKKTGLKNIAPDTFKNLKGLYHLTLSHNKFIKLDKRIFRHFNSLSLLDLAYNEIESLDGDLFATLSELCHLYLESNKILYIGEDFLKHNKNIKRVHLQENICISFNFNFVQSDNVTLAATFYDTQHMFHLNCPFQNNRLSNNSATEKLDQHMKEDTENSIVIFSIVAVYIVSDLFGLLIITIYGKKLK